jgi:hypothetical protein
MIFLQSSNISLWLSTCRRAAARMVADVLLFFLLMVPCSNVQEISAWMLAAALADPCGRLLCSQALM